jgi:hypothetical protein
MSHVHLKLISSNCIACDATLDDDTWIVLYSSLELVMIKKKTGKLVWITFLD